MATVLVMHMAGFAMRGAGMMMRMIMMLMRMIMMVMRVLMMRMVVMIMRVRGGRADAPGRAHRRPLVQERPALDPQKSRAHGGNQRVANDLDPPHRAVHGARRCAEKRCRD